MCLLQEFANRYQRQHHHPFEHNYWVRPVKVVCSIGGVCQFYHGDAFLANAVSLLALGLQQAAKGVHVDSDMQVKPVSKDCPPSSVQQLLQAYKAHMRLAQGDREEWEGKFGSQFQQAFRPTFTRFYRRNTVHFYAPAVGAGAIGEVQQPPKQQSPATEQRRHSIRSQGKAEDVGSTSEAKEGQQASEAKTAVSLLHTAFYTRWASFIANLVPNELHPGSAQNICRLLGYLPGVTQVYAYLGGGVHFFDMHFEELGMAAVNVRIRFSEPRQSTATVDLPRVTSRPEECTCFQKEFFDAVEEAMSSLRQGNETLKGLPYEAIKLFDAIGFKEWFTFVGDEADLLSLRDYIRKQTGYSEVDAPGITAFQHHELSEFKFSNGSIGENLHLTLDFAKLPAKYASMFQLVVQRGGDLVYTDCLLHVGRGICCFNSAWNVFPCTFSKRLEGTIGRCSPLSFNHKAAEHTRQEIGAIKRLEQGSFGHMTGGKFDSLSCMLAKTLFCASDTLELTSKLADGCADTESVMQEFEVCRREIVKYQLQHKGVDNQLHRQYGHRLLRDGCVPCSGSKRQRDGETVDAYKVLSSFRAKEMYLVSFLCTGCGVIMMLNKVYCPESNFAPQNEKEEVISLCSWCALDCCSLDSELVLVEVPRETLAGTGFEHLQEQRFTETEWC